MNTIHPQLAGAEQLVRHYAATEPDPETRRVWRFLAGYYDCNLAAHHHSRAETLLLQLRQAAAEVR